MKKKIIGIFICTLLITTILSTTGLGDLSNYIELHNKKCLGQFENGEYGDAPEGDSATPVGRLNGGAPRVIRPRLSQKSKVRI